jgi:hypothetical protein
MLYTVKVEKNCESVITVQADNMEQRLKNLECLMILQIKEKKI